MIDTIQIKNFYTRLIPEDELRRLGAIPLKRSSVPSWAINPVNDLIVPRITLAFPRDGKMHISAEISMPRLLFGNNIELPGESDVAFGLSKICDFVTDRTGRSFPFDRAVVRRVDFARNVRVDPDQTFRTIRFLAERRLPKMDKQTYNDSSIYFSNNSKQIRIYSKYHEVVAKSGNKECAKDAKGVLRFEYSLRSIYAIRSVATRFTSGSRLAINLLTQAVSDSVIDELLERLKFSNLPQQEKRSNLQTLLARFSYNKAMLLNSVEEMVELYGPKFYSDINLGISKHTYYRWRRDLQSAGIVTRA